MRILQGRVRFGASTLAGFGVTAAMILTASPVQANAGEQYVASWGQNSDGQLGDGSSTRRFAPVNVDASRSLANKAVVQVSGGAYHSCALAADGAVTCWGYNNAGQLGDGTNTLSRTPVEVDLSALTGRKVTQITLGRYHSCALTVDGFAFCWGLNGDGQLGDGTTESKSRAVAVTAGGALEGKLIKQIAAGMYHTCAVTTDGSVACWGWGVDGQLGNGDNSSSAVPVAVAGVLQGKTATQVASGSYSSCAVTNDGKVSCWGLNTDGQLGNGSQTNSAVPVAVDDTGGLLNKTVTQVASGFGHSCAVTSDGGVACWGLNWDGQLGTGVAGAPVLVPTAVVPGAMVGKAVTAVAAGGGHTCAVTSDRAGFCWGRNSNGQLGDNGSTSSAQPVAVTAQPGSFNAPKPVTSVAAGLNFTLATYGYSVRPGSPSGLAVAGTTLSWQGPAAAGGSDVSQYWVFYKPESQTAWKALARGVTGTSFNVSGSCTAPQVCPKLYGAVPGTSPTEAFTTVAVGNVVFWADMGAGRIYRLDLATGTRSEVATVSSWTRGITADATHLYWTDGQYVGRAKLDGTQVNTRFMDLGAGALSVGVAVTDSHIYLTQWFQPGILQANKSDGNARMVIVSGLPLTSITGVVATNEGIYWSDFGNGRIGRANLDGTSPNLNYLLGQPEVTGVTVVGDRLYWTLRGLGQVRTANTVDKVVTTVGTPGYAIYGGPSVSNGQVYWAAAGRIGRLGVDGSAPIVVSGPGTNYQFQVLAVNSHGHGRWSNAATYTQ